MPIMDEQWKTTAQSPKHEVSNFGRIRGPRGLISGHVRRYPGTGRPKCVLVSLGRKAQSLRVHRVVLEAFVGPCPIGMEGCHFDGDPTNNNLENLRWDTPESNRTDLDRHGTRRPPPVKIGEAHHNAYLTDEQVREIRRLGVGFGEFFSTAERYGVSHQTIRRIVAGQTRMSA